MRLTDAQIAAVRQEVDVDLMLELAEAAANPAPRLDVMNTEDGRCRMLKRCATMAGLAPFDKIL
ncbi:MAG: hypothetical protein R8J85_09210 [Mariprofundales bacterium]